MAACVATCSSIRSTTHDRLRKTRLQMLVHQHNRLVHVRGHTAQPGQDVLVVRQPSPPASCRWSGKRRCGRRPLATPPASHSAANRTPDLVRSSYSSRSALSRSVGFSVPGDRNIARSRYSCRCASRAVPSRARLIRPAAVVLAAPDPRRQLGLGGEPPLPVVVEELMQRLRRRAREARPLRRRRSRQRHHAVGRQRGRDGDRDQRGARDCHGRAYDSDGSLNAISSAAMFGGALIASTMYCWPLCK